MEITKNHEFVELILTCASWQEAQKIADHLLEKKLIACAEFIESHSKYIWKNKIEDAKEVTIFMQSIATYFKNIEAEVTKLHSYETFVLRQIPLSLVSSDAVKWLEDSLIN